MHLRALLHHCCLLGIICLLLQARETVILPYEIRESGRAFATGEPIAIESGKRLGAILYIRDSDNDADSDEDPDDDLDI